MTATTDARTYTYTRKWENHTVAGIMKSTAAESQSHARTKKQNSDQRGNHGRSATVDAQTHTRISGFCMFLLFLAYSFGPQKPNE